LSEEEFRVWLLQAATRQDYQRRLAIWLTHAYRFHAAQIAWMLQVSVQAVWLWVGQYNKQGPGGLERVGRGGRRWAFMSWTDEEALLAGFAARASRGEVITAKALWPEIETAVGRKVSLDYVYRLLHRHKWRKMGPRPRHVKGDPEAQEEFKKNSRRSSMKRSRNSPLTRS
jgi:transposase